MDTAIAFCHLKQHKLLTVKGPDAKKFLQGQVTCDINTLAKEKNTSVAAPLGAHCTHKGRVVFSFRSVELPTETEIQEIALSIPSDIVDIATAVLKKYSVFSKVDINTDNDHHQLFGVNGKNAKSILQTFAKGENIPVETNTACHTSAGTIMCIAKECYELWLNTEQAKRFSAHVASEVIQGETILNEIMLDDEYWDEVKIKNGIAEIHANTSGAFTPHAINYHNIGNAVSFSKGCYTGQEVVARMQYLGNLKRQLYLFTRKTTPSPPSPTTLPTDTLSAGGSLYVANKTQSVGDIVMVSHHKQQTYLLASTKVEYAEKETVFADIDNEYPLQLITC
jgi:tRNA-modifying protein YgfZ